MNAPDDKRGHHLTQKAALPGARGGFFDSLRSNFYDRIIRRIDAGMEAGQIIGHMPDGTVRCAGGRGVGPQAVIHIHDMRTFTRIARAGSIGLYEGWAAGDWSSPDPVPIFDLFVRNRLAMGRVARASGLARMFGRGLHWLNRNTQRKARENIEAHYDLGNDFYSRWLDPSMTYSSAVFEELPASDTALEAAQARKMALLLERLQLQPGHSMLEIGCGWGGLAEMACSRCAVDYHGITLSPSQKAYADQRLAKYANAAITLTDYRAVNGQYDAIASIEMVEAVGQKYWPAYLDCIARNLKPGGRAAIQYIRIEDDVFDAYAKNVDFIQRYIFPGGMLLSESRFRRLAEERGLIWQDQVDYGPHYAETLRLWRARFDCAVAAGQLPAGFDDAFVALWRFYLMYCEGGFRGGGINVAQVTLRRK